MNGEAARQPVLMRDAVAPARAAAMRPGGMILASDLGALEADWLELADAAVEQNPFYAPFMLLPALAHMATGDVRIAEIRGCDGTLVGLAPLAPQRGYSRLPVSYVATWMHPHCFFAAPLVRRGFERDFFAALFTLVEEHPSRPLFLRLQHLDADGPLIGAAEAAAAEAGLYAYRSGAQERALLKGGYDAKTYLEATIRKKKRKEMNRLRNRLEEAGKVELRTLASARELDPWCEEFLALEAAGWKGENGSALASNAAHAEFFREAVRGAFDAGALEFFRLDVSGRPIAMIVDFITQGEGYSFKIAHDEEFARYSPGVMIEVEMLKALESHASLKFVDSCARSDHPMINSLWAERRRIVGLNVSRRNAASRALLTAANVLSRTKARLMRKAPAQAAAGDAEE